MSKPLPKKQERLTDKAMRQVLALACRRQLPIRLQLEGQAYNSVFLEVDDQHLILENPFHTLDELRQLRHRSTPAYFLFHTDLYRTELLLAGLTTLFDRRSLKFFIPSSLVSDEKRNVRRVYVLPLNSTLSISNERHDLFAADPLDLSPSGIGLAVTTSPGDAGLHFPRGGKIFGDLRLGNQLAIPFAGEIRYTKPQLGQEAVRLKMGLRFLNLDLDLQERLNRWIFDVLAIPAQPQPKRMVQPPSFAEESGKKHKNAILVIGSNPDDTSYWRALLGRKYHVMTSDLNIANIRSLLATGPMLLMIYMDTQDSERASYTRKLCSALLDRFPIVFFGPDTNKSRRQAATNQIRHLSFINTSQRQLIDHFRMIDAVCNNLSKPDYGRPHEPITP